jgi:diaminohydroxyphosphoribosylaminopyrimidine deaminase/5-amino-6-(5-phosphoribosylamino)uracil reductase
VVSLEPCGHAGKQPPCTERILASGIRRVVFALADPNPIAGGAAESLRHCGVEVDQGLLRDRAERQNAPYLHALREASRPFVALKLATSLDHRIADSAGHSRWISGEEARDFVHWHRAGYDAIGVGGRTAIADDPALTVRGPVEPRIPPRRVIFLGSRRLPLEATVVRSAREVPTIAVVDPAAADGGALADAGVEVVAARSLREALMRLRERGIASIVIEGGGRLAGSLVAEGLVDRFTWIVSPVWLGERGVPATRGIDVPSLLEAERWTLVDRKGLGQDTLLVFDRR